MPTAAPDDVVRGMLAEWRAGIAALAALSNVHIKARARARRPPPRHTRAWMCAADRCWACIARAAATAAAAAAQISSPVYTYRALVGGDAGARAAAVGGAGALVAEVIAAFGPARCMFASNLPVDKFIAGSDGVAVMAATVALLPATLSPAERAGILEGNARRFYRF